MNRGHVELIRRVKYARKVYMQNKGPNIQTIINHSYILYCGFINIAIAHYPKECVAIKACQEYVLNIRISSQSVRDYYH